MEQLNSINLNCLIVDDDLIFRELIKRMCEFNQSLNIIGECSTAMEAYQKIIDEKIDLVFLDINMPNFSGLDLAQTLQDKRPMIIFTSSNTEFAINAFDLNVIDFLAKPIALPRFLIAIEKALAFSGIKSANIDSSIEDFVFIKDSNSIKRIKISDILFLEASGDYVQIYLSDKTFSIRSSLQEVEKKLTKISFSRVHRSFIVNISKIDTIEGKTLIINNHFIPISTAYKNELNKKMFFL
jgi:two-component system LytT family response regulator